MRTGHDGRGMESGLPLFRPKKTDRKFGSRISTAQPGQLPQSTDSQILPPRRMANCGRRMGKTFCSSQMLIRNAMGTCKPSSTWGGYAGNYGPRICGNVGFPALRNDAAGGNDKQMASLSLLIRVPMSIQQVRKDQHLHF